MFLCTPLVFLAFLITFISAPEGKPSVIIRFDDYGVWCNEDWVQIEESVIKMHEKNNVKLTYAVIPESKYPLVRHKLSPQSYPEVIDSMSSNPFPLDPNSRRVQVLKDAVKGGTIEVALHGYYHPKGYSNTDRNTEFYNIPYDTQYWKLARGKQLLDSLFETNVVTLVPPHNTYDNLTLDLLEELEFKCISAKPNSFDAPMDPRLSIRYLWYTTADCNEFNRILRKKHYQNEPPQIIQLHHTNFTTGGKMDTSKLEAYDRMLTYIKDNKIPNYTFSSYPMKDKLGDDLQTKYLNQFFIKKSHEKLAAKLRVLCGYLSPMCLMMVVLYAFLSALLGIAIYVRSLLNIKEKYFRAVLAVLIVTFIVCFFNAYCLSPYDAFYFLFTKKFALLCFLIVLILPFCIKYQTANNNDL